MSSKLVSKRRSVGRLFQLLALFSCMLAAGKTAAALPAFTITDVGRLGGTGSAGFGINNRGQVTGRSQDRAFLWTPTKPNGVSGTMIDLGTLGGDSSVGNGINDHGQVTGASQTTSGDYTSHAFLYDGALNDLQTLGGTYSQGMSINNSGQVVGHSFATGDRATLAFMYDGALHDLGTLGGPSSEATAINESGQVIGLSYLDETFYRAMLWTPTTPHGSSGKMIDLGTLGGESSAAYAINDSGHVTGRSSLVGEAATRAFLYDGTMHDLGSLGGDYSEGHGVNNFGQVVGNSTLPTGPGIVGQHAFWYTSDQGMLDLNVLIDPQSGWELTAALGINDIGQITGLGYVDGAQHAFLLTPVAEPSSAALLGLGVFGLFRMLRRRGGSVARVRQSDDGLKLFR